MDLASIDLSDPKFWDLPLAERASVFDRLRSEDPYRYFELPPEITEQFPQRGFHALVRHADVAEASRRPDDRLAHPAGPVADLDLAGVGPLTGRRRLARRRGYR